MIINFLKKVKHKLRIRTRYRDLKKKFKSVAYIYRTNGPQGVQMYLREGIQKRIYKNNPIKETGDVLLISITDELLDRYRTDHMKEALESVGVTVGKIYYYELKPEHVKRYNVFIFYRCPWIKEYDEIVKQIKDRNKVVVFAVDDLVIDRKYTDTLASVKALAPEDRKVYDDGVERHGKMLRHCDYAITTTNDLAEELRNYKNLKEIYVDRNSMSDEMIHYSNKAVAEVKKDSDKIVIGYFSGTNTHNEDFQMVAPAITKILDKYDNVYIKLAGRLDAPDEFKGYEERLIYTPYVNWRQLPFELRKCDITLSPLVDSVFNRSKSENKWAESSLVGVATVASDIGAFTDSVENNETGILVKNTTEAWFEGMKRLIENKNLREEVAQRAREYVLKNYRASGKRAVELKGFINKITPPIIAFGGINISAISGGNMVVKRHMDILREAGNIVYGVESMDYHENDQWQEQNNEDDKEYDFFRINSHRKADKVSLKMHFDKFVATFWKSVDMVDQYVYIKKGGKKLYLVQGMEALFYGESSPYRSKILATYRNHRLEPITISKWCQKWLKEDFDRDAKYAPNGIDSKEFAFVERDFKSRKIRVLIEGDSKSEYKRVDESFKIANQLDRDRFEVSYLSYNGKAKDWYKVDNSYAKVPYGEVSKIYQNHDILLKSSILESFSYPPLEMIATGGMVVVAKNDGNAEYLIDGYNGFTYEAGNTEAALEKIKRIAAKSPKTLRDVQKNGQKTAKERDWGNCKKDVLSLYKD